MLNQKYLNKPSALASFSYSDIAEGTGIQLFYFAQDAAGAHILTQNQVTSTTKIEGGTNADFDDDYDLSAFNMPQTIRGKAMFSFHFVVGAAAHGVLNSVYLRKWDGTTETEIVAASGSTFVHSGGAASYPTDLVTMDVPLTHFKKGEQIRVSVLLTVTADDWIYYGTDPTAEPDLTYFAAGNSTQSKAYIPFDLDL